MRMLRCLLMIVAVGFVGAETLADRLQAAAQDVRTLRLPFVQTKVIALFDETVTTPGVVEIDRQAGALRWEFTGRSTFILNRGRLRKWGADGGEEVGLDRDPNLAALKAQMQAMLSGDWAGIEDRFATAYTDDPPAVTLTPRDAVLQRYLDSIRIVFRTDLSAPAALELHAEGGDRTDYAFAEPVLNEAIEASRFSGP